MRPLVRRSASATTVSVVVVALASPVVTVAALGMSAPASAASTATPVSAAAGVSASGTRQAVAPVRIGLPKMLPPHQRTHLRVLGLAGTPTSGVAAVQVRVRVSGRGTGGLKIWPVGHTRPRHPTIKIGLRHTAAKAISLVPGRFGEWFFYNGTRRGVTVSVVVRGYSTADGVSHPGGGAGGGSGGGTGGGPTHPPGIDMPVSSNGRVDIGSPLLRDIWVNPTIGDDSASGATSGTAVRTVAEAWGRIPVSLTLTTGYRLQLMPGTYPADQLPNYWENRFGTASHPIIFNAVGGRGTAVFAGDMNVYNTSHLYVLGVSIVRSGDAFHCDTCSNLLLNHVELSGGARAAHETLKVNQSDHVYVEDSNIHGADDNAIDFVAVQYGHVLGNKVHDSQDWCEYAKGGSAYLTVAENEFYDCGTGGFTAGQGTGFEFMTAPWIHYEANDIKVVNNVIHDTEGAGLGVNGGYNILLAYNTMYRVGSRDHAVEFVFGARECDGDSTACTARHDLGGWGSAQGESDGWIPNKHVYFYNNVVYNPSGFRSAWIQFAVYPPRHPPAGNNLGGTTVDDEDLRIVNNIVYNGPGQVALGLGGGDGCADTNPTCTAAMVTAANAINTEVPAFVNAAGGNFNPTPGGNVETRAGVAIPPFSWVDKPVSPAMPDGETSNAVTTNRAGVAHSPTVWGHVGAY